MARIYCTCGCGKNAVWTEEEFGGIYLVMGNESSEILMNIDEKSIDELIAELEHAKEYIKGYPDA